MTKYIVSLLLMSFVLYADSPYKGSTTAAVTLSGGIIKAKHSEDTNKKYNRKDCPVCKGKGWYMSGDGIKRIDCAYCEPEKELLPEKPEPQPVTAPAAKVPANSAPNTVITKPAPIFHRR